MLLNSLSKYNAELRRHGIAAELVKGEGYFYYVGIEYPSVYVNSYCHLSPARWRDEFNAVKAFWGASAERFCAFWVG